MHDIDTCQKLYKQPNIISLILFLHCNGNCKHTVVLLYVASSHLSPPSSLSPPLLPPPTKLGNPPINNNIVNMIMVKDDPP